MNKQHKLGAKLEELPTGSILVGDAIEQLRRLPDTSIDCVVTSPPYMNLRNNAVDGQYGLEHNVDDWVDHLVAVLDELARVLKTTGSVWLNINDTYARRDFQGAPPKGLLLGPERLVIAAAARGWRVRNKVVWVRHTRPASARDRLSNTYEVVYLLVRDRFPFFDLDAIRIPHRAKARPTRESLPTRVPDWQGPFAGTNSGLVAMKREGRVGHVLGANPKDVWAINHSGFRGSHYSTFPERLVERPLLATCPERNCRKCGRPWIRELPKVLGELAVKGDLAPSCRCSAPFEPGIVLDCFLGAGTTAVVAERLGRRWLGIELNPIYVAIAKQRLADIRGHPRAAA